MGLSRDEPFRVKARAWLAGVSGFGTGQACVRFQRIRQDQAPVTLLGFSPEHIMLDVNQYRGFLGYGPSPWP